MPIKSLIAAKAQPGILVVLMLLIGASGSAQTWTLEQVLDSIAANYPGLQQFSMKAAASFAEGEAAKAWDATTAGVGLEEFLYGSGKPMGGGAQPRRMTVLRLEQMFPNFARQHKESAYYRSLRQQEKDDSATMSNMLFARAKIAYYRACVAEKKLAMLKQQEKELELFLQLVTRRLPYDQGELPQLYRGQAELSELHAARQRLQSAGMQAVAILNSLMSRPQDSPLPVDTGRFPEAYNRLLPAADTAGSAGRRSDIARIAHDIQSLRLSREAAALDARPRFGLGWSNMRMQDGGYMYSAMATLSIPIVPWFSRGYRSKTEAIGYQIQAKQKEYAAQLQEAAGQLRTTWLQWEAAEKDWQLFRDEVLPAYRKTYESFLHAFSENRGSIYETLKAWEDLTQKQTEYWDKVADLLAIRVQLEAELQRP